MSFEEYLVSKKIDSSAYKASEPDQWKAFSAIFEQMHPKSFTMQKLNLINGIRRQFPYVASETEQVPVMKKVARPVMKVKIQTVAEESKPSKPVVKPKIVATKPKMGKPVMKPKMKSTSREEKNEETKPKPIMKPKMVRPVIKSKSKE